MIVFNLTCSNAHKFEGWFGSSADFDQQQRSTMLNCPVCGCTQINKALHAPYVNTGSTQRTEKDEHRAQAREVEKQYTNVAREVAQIVEHLIANTEDVGNAFPEEARKIHYKETPERKIRGNASHNEVKELREEGIDVIALPIPKHRLSKTH